MRVKIKPEFRHLYSYFTNTSAELEVVDSFDKIYRIKEHSWPIVKEHADIIEEADKLDIHEEKEGNYFVSPDYIYSGYTKAVSYSINEINSSKLHKDISSTILSVLAKNFKINELSGRELLCLVGEIADEVVKDVESYKSNSKQ